MPNPSAGPFVNACLRLVQEHQTDAIADAVAGQTETMPEGFEAVADLAEIVQWGKSFTTTRQYPCLTISASTSEPTRINEGVMVVHKMTADLAVAKVDRNEVMADVYLWGTVLYDIFFQRAQGRDFTDGLTRTACRGIELTGLGYGIREITGGKGYESGCALTFNLRILSI